jgi:hypothetical protein
VGGAVDAVGEVHGEARGGVDAAGGRGWLFIQVSWVEMLGEGWRRADVSEEAWGKGERRRERRRGR